MNFLATLLSEQNLDLDLVPDNARGACIINKVSNNESDSDSADDTLFHKNKRNRWESITPTASTIAPKRSSSMQYTNLRLPKTHIMGDSLQDELNAHSRWYCPSSLFAKDLEPKENIISLKTSLTARGDFYGRLPQCPERSISEIILPNIDNNAPRRGRRKASVENIIFDEAPKKYERQPSENIIFDEAPKKYERQASARNNAFDTTPKKYERRVSQEENALDGPPRRVKKS